MNGAARLGKWLQCSACAELSTTWPRAMKPGADLSAGTCTRTGAGAHRRSDSIRGRTIFDGC